MSCTKILILFVLFAINGPVFGQEKESKTEKEEYENAYEVQALIEDGLKKNEDKIIEKVKTLSEEKREFLYKTNEMNPWTSGLLEPGLGLHFTGNKNAKWWFLGSYCIGLSSIMLGSLDMIAYLAGFNSFSLSSDVILITIGMTWMYVTRAIEYIITFKAATEYNVLLKNIIRPLRQFRPVVDNNPETGTIIGAALTARF